jgi:hypothetical protein
VAPRSDRAGSDLDQSLVQRLAGPTVANGIDCGHRASAQPRMQGHSAQSDPNPRLPSPNSHAGPDVGSAPSTHGSFPCPPVYSLSSVPPRLPSSYRLHLIKCGMPTGNSIEIGRVLHTWSNNIAGVEAVANYSIRQNEKLYAGGKNIVPVTVMSLRIGQVDHPSIDLAPHTQFGLRLDSKIPVGASLFKWNLS